ncbi:MAG: phenylalanine--tRNA ligase subunit beta [Andreesenia angusta]|nr:phenylalanine--tRNA ligase subunit beta [Andreesenia angusta]
MFVPVKWLKDYIDIEDYDIRKLADKLNETGSHVESIESVDKGVEKVVVGRIEEIEKHPDADKLIITKIDIGEEELLQIVTGANNVKEGDLVPVALVGAKLPGGIKIKKGKLRGVESFGMLCSAAELGYSDSVIPKLYRDGIHILQENYEIGKDIREVFGLNEEIIEFEITPNRPDCLSILGMARELGATIEQKIKYPDMEVKEEEDDIKDYFNELIVEDKDLCNAYYARVIKDVKVEESPLWLQTRLMEAGMRPLNNIVDITNYVMLELGQPLHAFDLDKLEDKKIIVKRAENGDVFKTLDDVERKLDDSMLMINDGKNQIAIAGVMGGLDSEVTEDTKTILLESASFNPKSVRLTSKKLGLRTEASTRFEKGLDPNLAKIAGDRVCELIEEINAGKVVKGNFFEYGQLPEPKEIRVKLEKIDDLIGQKIDRDRILNMLNYLEIESKIEGEEVISNIPTFRTDISIPVDIIEEIARIYGFDNIETKPLSGVITRGRKSCIRNKQDWAKDLLTSMGLNEIMTYSFVSPSQFDKLNISENSVMRKYVKIRNPLGEDYSVMRTTLLGNMMDVLVRNSRYGIPSIGVYEIGNIFIPNEIPVKTIPKEKRVLSIGMYGDGDFFTMKGIIDELLEKMGIEGYEYVREENNPTFHPGRAASIVCENYYLGEFGEVHPDVQENYGLKNRVYMAELDFNRLFFLKGGVHKYKPLAKYPSISRDIALLVDKEIMVKEIEKIIRENGGELVKRVELFDVYEGDQIDNDKKSVAYSIEYNSEEKTLTDEELTPIHQKVLDALEKELDAHLRT